MKTRFYQKNVVDGEKAMKRFVKRNIHEFHMHILAFILCFIAAVAVNLIVGIPLYRHTKLAVSGMLLAPLIVRLSVYEIRYLYGWHACLKLLKLDRSFFSDWMNLQCGKNISQTEWAMAFEIFDTYRFSYIEKHDELIELLEKQLKIKPAKPLVVSVIAGLVFSCGNKKDYKILFQAKYRHGAAGSIMPDVWVSTLAADETAFPELHRKRTSEFLGWWDKKEAMSKR